MTDDRGYSALSWATCMFPFDTDLDGRKLKTVRVLHQAGININHQDIKNRTGQYTCIQCIIQQRWIQNTCFMVMTSIFSKIQHYVEIKSCHRSLSVYICKKAGTF